MPAQAYAFTLVGLADAATQTALRKEADSLAAAFDSTRNLYGQAGII
jgi:hypothetical protein